MTFFAWLWAAAVAIFGPIGIGLLLGFGATLGIRVAGGIKVALSLPNLNIVVNRKQRIRTEIDPDLEAELKRWREWMPDA